MNVKKRLARLENFVEGMQTVDPYKTERYQIIRKGMSQLTDDEKFLACQHLKNWQKNGNSWQGIEHEERNLLRWINRGLSRLPKMEIEAIKVKWNSAHEID